MSKANTTNLIHFFVNQFPHFAYFRNVSGTKVKITSLSGREPNYCQEIAFSTQLEAGREKLNRD